MRRGLRLFGLALLAVVTSLAACAGPDGNPPAETLGGEGTPAASASCPPTRPAPGVDRLHRGGGLHGTVRAFLREPGQFGGEARRLLPVRCVSAVLVHRQP